MLRGEGPAQFKVGDKVVVMQNYQPSDFTTVKRVMKKFLELENGEKYQLSGRDRYPRPDHSWTRSTPHIEHANETHRLFVDLSRKMNRIRMAMENIDKVFRGAKWMEIAENAEMAATIEDLYANASISKHIEIVLEQRRLERIEAEKKNKERIEKNRQEAEAKAQEVKTNVR